jgi:hypothetical protein
MKKARVEDHKGDEKEQGQVQLRARRRHLVAFLCS